MIVTDYYDDSAYLAGLAPAEREAELRRRKVAILPAVMSRVQAGIARWEEAQQIHFGALSDVEKAEVVEAAVKTWPCTELSVAGRARVDAVASSRRGGASA